MLRLSASAPAPARTDSLRRRADRLWVCVFATEGFLPIRTARVAESLQSLTTGGDNRALHVAAVKLELLTAPLPLPCSRLFRCNSRPHLPSRRTAPNGFTR